MTTTKWKRSAPSASGWYWARMECDNGEVRTRPLFIDSSGMVIMSTGGMSVRISASMLPCTWIPIPIKEPK